MDYEYEKRRAVINKEESIEKTKIHKPQSISGQKAYIFYDHNNVIKGRIGKGFEEYLMQAELMKEKAMESKQEEQLPNGMTPKEAYELERIRANRRLEFENQRRKIDMIRRQKQNNSETKEQEEQDKEEQQCNSDKSEQEKNNEEQDETEEKKAAEFRNKLNAKGFNTYRIQTNYAKGIDIRGKDYTNQKEQESQTETNKDDGRE